jgi:FHA domain/Domain of unknown function (DUF1707)
MRERLLESMRERVVARLQSRYACGALATETFERRLDGALTAESLGALRSVTARRTADRSSGLLAAVEGSRPTVLGRSRACDVVLADDSVSRRHAMLVREGDRVVLTDLGSTNGTLVNGRWVTQAEVRPGDQVRLGGLDLVL